MSEIQVVAINVSLIIVENIIDSVDQVYIAMKAISEGRIIMRKEVFISYALIDAEWAEWIAVVLESYGFSVFVGARDLRPGDDFILKLNEAIHEADIFIPILSDAYVNSLYCKAEFSTAYNAISKGKKIIPVRVADVVPPGLLARISYIDLYDSIDETEAKNRLFDAINKRETPRNLPSYPGDIRFSDTEYPGGLPANNLPQRKNYFIGRDQNLKKILIAFEKSVFTLITGIGGIGKTQLALEYAYRYGVKYKSVIWFISAVNERTVLNGFIDFCNKNGIKLPEGYAESDVQRLVKQWLEQNGSWLFILDDLEQNEVVMPYLPANPSGHFLITTKTPNSELGTVINIGELSEDESIEVLKQYLLNVKTDELITLAKKLEYLPLALERAASYILATGLSITEYLHRFDSAKKGLSDDDKKPFNEFDNVMFTLLQITLSNISTGARQLLNLCAYMAPYGIPLKLFMRNRDLLPEPLKSCLGEISGVAKLTDELGEYALIKVSQQEFSIHSYIQEYLRYTQEDCSEWIDVCLKIFLSDLPREFDDWESQETFVHLAEHAHSVANYAYSAFKHHEIENSILELYFRLGYGFYKIEQIDKALKFFEKTLTLADRFPGNNYNYVAVTYSNIARIYDAQGKYQDAIMWYQKALSVNESILGNEHPNVAQTYVNIATIYYNQHKYNEALEINLKALKIQEKMLGVNHLTTAATYENIASIYYNLNDLNASLSWHLKALAVFEKMVGTAHPDTANTLNNIGVLYDDQGDHHKAFEYYQKALNIFEKVFGKDNVNIAQAYNNIALNYKKRGDYDKAHEWYKRALPVFVSVFGTAHPFTATLRANLESWKNENYTEMTNDIHDILQFKNILKNLPDAEINEFCQWYTSLDDSTKSSTDLDFRIFLNELRMSIKKIKEYSEFSIDDDCSPELCQYTKLSTLKFLVKASVEDDKIPTPKFRLSNVAYLNDPSEGQVFIDLLNQCVATPIFDDIFGISTEKNSQPLAEVRLNDVYIGSFTTAKNKLPMWTLYGDNSKGCCVVFDNSFFISPKSQADPNNLKEYEQDIKLYRVHYYNTRELGHVDDEIMRSLRIIATSIKRWDKIVTQNPKLLSWIVNRLGEIRFLFKCDDYLYEDEVRLILRDDRVNKPFVDRSADVSKLYINVNNPVVLKEVILGAKIDNPSAPAQFLLFAGIKKVTLSGITYR